MKVKFLEYRRFIYRIVKNLHNDLVGKLFPGRGFSLGAVSARKWDLEILK